VTNVTYRDESNVAIVVVENHPKTCFPWVSFGRAIKVELEESRGRWRPGRGGSKRRGSRVGGRGRRKGRDIPAREEGEFIWGEDKVIVLPML
jgi:hypothetical protein